MCREEVWGLVELERFPPAEEFLLCRVVGSEQCDLVSALRKTACQVHNSNRPATCCRKDWIMDNQE